MAETEKLKKVSDLQSKEVLPKKNGGKRPGSGMPKGKKTAKVLEKMKALADYKQRVMKHTDELFNAQFNNAIGNMFIYEKKPIKDKKGNVIKHEHILVTQPNKIKEILDSNNGGSGEVGDRYYIVTTAKPDNTAIKDMLDRTFGTPTQSVELTGKDGDDITLKVKKIIVLDGNDKQ